MDFKLGEKRKEHFMGGGKEKQEQQRKKGKLIVFERMNALFDSGSFVEEVSDKSKKINYEQIIKEIVTHIMTFCIGYKATLIKP